VVLEVRIGRSVSHTLFRLLAKEVGLLGAKNEILAKVREELEGFFG
jgi:hypothetical protein